jgi:hypothetical protein
MIFTIYGDIMIAADIIFNEGSIMNTWKYAILQDKIIFKNINEFGILCIINCNDTVLHGM